MRFFSISLSASINLNVSSIGFLYSRNKIVFSQWSPKFKMTNFTDIWGIYKPAGSFDVHKKIVFSSIFRYRLHLIHMFPTDVHLK